MMILLVLLFPLLAAGIFIGNFIAHDDGTDICVQGSVTKEKIVCVERTVEKEETVP